MKVCFFAHYSKTYQNGATLSLINIANEMANKGIEVIIIIPNRNLKIPLDNKNIKCITVPAFTMRVPINYKNSVSKAKGIVKSLYNWFAMKKALSILKKEKPDIIHINGLDLSMGAEIALKLNIPYVWHIRQLLEEDFGMRLRNEKKIYKLLNKSDAIIAISETVKKKYEKKLNRDIILIYNGIPIEKYIIEDKKNFSSETINLLLAGRIVGQKGQLDAIKAINYLVKSGIENVNLVIAGNMEDIHYAKRIKDYISEHMLHDYIEIIEYVNDLKQLRKKCDIGLVCSKKEAFGRVTIETMVSRMLVIGANTGGTIEIIQDNVNGLLYQEGDYTSLANRIKYAVDNKNEISILIEKGYTSAIERYSITNVVEQIMKVYHTSQIESPEK
ncbi:glycosyltransferase family 4 protein [Oceanobacillus sp. CFH 90083]|uniref:glycosyltransferase family 4 protein n=1 Tax=Oceanobacillus sp. CFH 90083 TaxID=2592336 RepID=UPI00128AF5BF|nr:glycosyltransferase family 4 protein [Oceanobacillus sp. CFH 90083]